ncbi:MAG: VOC family protein [Rhodothermales bacterium]
MSEKPVTGTIGWFDLTVDDADRVRDFYQEVVGWSASPLSMGDYNDYVMATPDGTPVSGVCHARGGNAGLPAQWLMYVNVDDIEASRAAVERLGGALITSVKHAEGHGSYCVIRDPAGAVIALFQPE